ncbi:hypothetical protein DL766_007370 [Monosporascus sp. MC13-8B]|uniref:Protein kinase domain-containing protein n=1 Tax=Monosporascus cannonballus TaxID=155416 RepID=A0ABY0H352_9PEZI|nr:hypothetical protein DL762_007626 [Monosporascus cannonballus]RYO85239.1 hypothetical protein DL763_007180 [Monosporascus cannonballus]RYP24113.1 hypothetical protein DL766_007370 [Monosporascus sp. MC13-8B]
MLIKELSDKVDGAYETNHKNFRFLPCDQLAVFVTPENVDDVLEDAGVPDAKHLAKFVLKDAKKLFLILVMMTEVENEKISLLADLKRSNISDASLPIQFVSDGVGCPYYWSSLERSPEEKSEFLGNWDRTDRALLADTYQWHFLAPNANGEGIAIAIKKARHDDELAEFFDKEASNLHKLQQYKSPHLIKPIAAYQIDQDRCLIFPWANGGNLRDYWKGNKDQRGELSSLQWLLGQLKGICSAIQELHVENTRHGDLKPENILWFKDGNDGGFLQIADLGLATFHEKDKHTKNRKGMGTFALSGTSRYEPPEIDEKRNTVGPWSRQYDMWSMGCVLLETLLWLIYGYESIGVFQDATTHFWVCHDRPDRKEYFVHPYVDSCMRVMKTNLQGQSAYRDLLLLVQERLLVVAVSETYGSFPDYRETAETLHTAVEEIIEKSRTIENYLAPVALEYPADRIREQQQQNVVYQAGGNLAAPRRDDVPRSSPILATHDAPSIDGNGGLKVLVRAPTGDFNSSSLSTNASANTKHQQIGSDPPEGAQLGLPKLLEPASPDQFTLLKQWVKVCDLSHEMCRRKDGDVPTMPTRLIEIGNTIRLVDSARIDPAPYIALSHCWGPLKDNAKFCTFKYNIDQLRRSIEFERLPLTFKDAVSVVRGLGFRYIWIDSLCIIQDDQGDWEYEAARMEQVFSGASKAAFLGDANFPESALEYYRDGRQVLVQDLYERYSALAFTTASDRSVAILGLQKRLERAFQTQAAFGLFAVYFGRGLLWQRRGIKPMRRIAWPPGRRVPSWSWFSKEGPIKYMSLQFEKIDWAAKQFRSPFQRQAAVGFKKPSDAREDRDLTALRGRARILRLTKLEMLVGIRFDAEEEFDIDRLRCVVIGRDKADHGTDDPKQHVLVVHPLDSLEKGAYERVGVASLRPEHVGDEGPWIIIR